MSDGRGTEQALEQEKRRVAGLQADLALMSAALRAAHARTPECGPLPKTPGFQVDLCRTPFTADYVFPSLASTIEPGRAAKGRVCIVTSEMVGATSNGGIGTAYTNLARLLAAAGHAVTILFLTRNGRASDAVKRDYAAIGIEVVEDDNFNSGLNGLDHNIRFSFGTYHWLKQCQFDVIHVPEMCGYGYFSMLAKRLGLAFANTTFVVGTHSPGEWCAEMNRSPMAHAGQLSTSFLERGSVALADVTWSPSRYMLGWMRERAWPLTEHTYFHRLPYLHNEGLPEETAPAAAPVNELVFFGRLETRKGIQVFCDAIDLLHERLGAPSTPFKVTFLGRNALSATGLPADYPAQRAAKWPHAVWQVIDNYDVADALSYIRAPGRLVIIPSLTDNSPNTVYECLKYRIPFVASKTGGIPELVAEAEHPQTLFEPDGRACGELLAQRLGREAAPVKPAFDFDALNDEWVRWHDWAVAAARQRAPQPASAARSSIGVCLIHANDCRSLWQALKGIERQSLPPSEVVVVDRGSTDEETVKELAAVEHWLAERNWRLLREGAISAGAARNRGALETGTDFLFFHDQDNFLHPTALETLAKAAAHAMADVLTPVYSSHGAADEPNDATPVNWRYVPMGGGLALVPVWNFNTLGDAAMLVRRAAFLALGGFTTDPIGHEDWEFLARAELAGFSLYSLPEPMVWKRNTSPPATDSFLNNRRNLRALQETLPPYLRLLLLYTQDVGRERDQFRDAAFALAGQRDQLVGKLQAAEKTLAGLENINEMLMQRLMAAAQT